MTDYAMQTIQVDGVTKYSINFALTDEAGAPLLDRNGNARVTNLISETVEDLVAKMAKANVEASRQAAKANDKLNTVMNRRPTPRAAAPDFKGKPLTQEEQVQVGLDAQDPRKAAAAIQRVVESVVPVAQITGEVERQAATLDLEARRRIAREFFFRHKADVADISANGAMLSQWLMEKGYEFSLDNLEIAFATLGDALAKPKPVVPANDPPPELVRNDAPRNDPPNSGIPPSQQRRAPVGGIPNSVASAQPGASVPVLTKAQAMEMLIKRPREYEAWMSDPVKNKILNAALASR